MQQTAYEQIGGDAGVRKVARLMYEAMEILPQAAACRAIHPKDLSGAEQKFYEYLSGWLGGPPLYTDKYGHPMLRRRHLPAPIGPEEREGWLLCFATAWAEVAADAPLRDLVMRKVVELAYHMQNTDGAQATGTCGEGTGQHGACHDHGHEEGVIQGAAGCGAPAAAGGQGGHRG
ncbi:MAG: group II truncated hemoglobin [Zavarzinia sp.]|nr:group II truncated hemoglobin [Zavarzinia sp.]